MGLLLGAFRVPMGSMAAPPPRTLAPGWLMALVPLPHAFRRADKNRDDLLDRKDFAEALRPSSCFAK